MFISFSRDFTVAKSSSVILKRSGKRGHPCLVLDLRGKTSGFSPLSMLATGAFADIFNLDEEVPISSLLRDIFKRWMSVGFCQVLFLHLLTWLCNFSSLACWCDGLP